MKMHALLITSGLLFALTGAAKADDHLFQATNNIHTQHGLTEDSTGFIHGDPAPGQGSPFTGLDQKIPATDNETANMRVNPTGAEKTTPSKPADGATSANSHDAASAHSHAGASAGGHAK
jgi:hypothetical protein